MEVQSCTQSLLPLEITEPLLARRREAEKPFVNQVLISLAARAALVGWQRESPTGLEALRQVVAHRCITADTRG
jgi:hypothetical protein